VVPGLLRQAIDRPVLRWPAAVVLSSVRSVKTRDPHLVTPTGSGLWVHRYRDGALVYPSVDGDSPSYHEAATLAGFCYRYRPRPGDVVMDIGAGIGEQVLTFSRLVGPTGKVVAVEAHPTTYEGLRRTVEINGLDNVTTVHAAIADQAGMTTMDGGGSRGYLGAAAHGGDTPVPAETLDGLVAELEIDRIDLLKMNIEGAEQLAIRDMEQTAARTSNVVVSCHDFIADSDPAADRDWYGTYRDVRGYLEGAGFLIAGHPPDRDRPWLAYYVYGSKPAP
jgi:FkbM family methyltransferase